MGLSHLILGLYMKRTREQMYAALTLNDLHSDMFKPHLTDDVICQLMLNNPDTATAAIRRNDIDPHERLAIHDYKTHRNMFRDYLQFGIDNNTAMRAIFTDFMQCEDLFWRCFSTLYESANDLTIHSVHRSEINHILLLLTDDDFKSHFQTHQALPQDLLDLIRDVKNANQMAHELLTLIEQRGG